MQSIAFARQGASARRLGLVIQVPFHAKKNSRVTIVWISGSSLNADRRITSPCLTDRSPHLGADNDVLVTQPVGPPSAPTSQSVVPMAKAPDQRPGQSLTSCCSRAR